jgi:adenylylsulfate kinase
MSTRILVMGLPGSGKTTFSQELIKRLMLNHTVSWFNADIVREKFNDWDFSDAGRLRQVHRMAEMSRETDTDFVVCDFVCPTEETRKIFNADIVIWMDTIREGRFADTNKIFTPPSSCTYHVTDWNPHWVKSIADYITKHGDSNRRSFVKAVSWRVWGTIDTFILSWLVTGETKAAVTISGLEVATKIVWFWLHERMWNKIKWGKQ